MNPHFWLSVACLISRIGLIEAAGQCLARDNSINGMFLNGHTFKTVQAGNPAICMMRCEEEVRCQSYNFVIGRNICELNDRTKEARSEDFKPDDQRLYMKRKFNRGSIQNPLKGNSGVKMKLFWMFGLGTMFQFLIILFTNSFLQLI